MPSIKALVLLLTASLTAAIPKWNELSDYTFEKFVADFGHEWTPDSTEWEHRKGLFSAELARVQAHNAQGKSWKEGINKFSAFTSSEMRV